MKFENISAVAFKLTEIDFDIVADLEVDREMVAQWMDAAEIVGRCGAKKITLSLSDDAAFFATSEGERFDVYNLAVEVGAHEIVLCANMENGSFIKSSPIALGDLTFAGYF